MSNINELIDVFVNTINKIDALRKAQNNIRKGSKLERAASLN
jgi:hypothetical protein